MPDQSPYRSIPYLYRSKGVVARITPDRCPPETYIDLDNCLEREEDAMSTRYGCQMVNRDPDGTPGGVNYLFTSQPHTISRLKSFSQTYRYVGAGTNLYRRAGDTQGTFTSISTALSGDAFSSLVSACYGSAQPFLFIADAAIMLKDSGTGTPTQWGIYPPNIVVSAQQYAPAIQIIDSFQLSTGYTTANYTISGDIYTDVAGTAATSELSGNYYQYLCVDRSVATVQNGMLEDSANGHGLGLLFNTAQDTSTFDIVAQTGVYSTTDTFRFHILEGSVAADTVGTVGKTVSFNFGGYQDDDLIVLAFKVGSPDNIQEIRLQFDVDGSGYTSSYYYKSLIPASYQSGITSPQTTDPSQAVVAAVTARSLGVTNLSQIGQSYSQIIPGDDPSIGQIQPSQISTGEDAWTVVYIRRGDFLPVGNAGTPGLDWSNITGWQLQVTTNTQGSTTIDINALYIQGGAGPSSYGGVGYDYLYTYFNATTLTESNPCALQYFSGSFSSGFGAPTVGSNRTGSGGIAWTNPGNITVYDGSSATVTLTSGQLSQGLFGSVFSSLVLPDDAEIRGILVEIVGTQSNSASDAVTTVQLYTTETATPSPLGNAKTCTFNTGSLEPLLLGGLGDLWGENFSPALFNAGYFAISIDGAGGAAGNSLAVDYVQVTVYLSSETLGTSTLVVLRQAIAVAGQYSADPQVTHVRIYRRGGTLTSTFLLVDKIPNVTGTGTWSYRDTSSDATISQGSPVAFDNDVPVTSTLVAPISTTLELDLAPVFPYNPITVNVNDPSVTFVPYQIVNIGNPGNLEQVYVVTGGTGSFTACVQLPHRGGEPVEAFSKPAQPCNLAAQAYNITWLAGDPNNPHLLYYSKTGFPENFPPQNYIVVSTPADPIQAIINFRGVLFVATLTTWYQVFPGNPPYTQTTGSKHGLFAQFGWTLTESSVWYQAIDGIRDFRGADGAYRSLPIEWVFQNGPSALTPIPLLNTADISLTSIALWNNLIFICYEAQDGNFYRVIWDGRYLRWRNDSVHANVVYLEADTNTLVYTKPILSGYGLFEDNVGDYDDGGWVSGALVQTPIAFTVQTPYLDQGFPNNQKQYNVVTIDANPNGQTLTVKLYFDDSDSISPITLGTFTGSTREKFQFEVNSGLGQQAYRVSIQITGSVTVAPIIYQADFHVAVLVEQRSSFDTYWINFGMEESKLVKQGYFDYTSTADITVDLYADGSTTPYYTFTLAANSARSGVPVRVRFPVAKLRLFRLVATSADAFQFWVTPQVDTKGICEGKNFTRSLLATT